MKQSLVDIQLVDGTRMALSRPLTEHLEDFKQMLTLKGSTQKNVDMVCSRIRKLLTGCQFRRWPDINFQKVSTYLVDKHNGGRGMSPQTANYYRQALSQFCKWMQREGRANNAPLGEIRKFNARADRRHARRALSVEEMRSLLQVARAGPILYGLTGEERHLLYTVAVETGLRANELRTLTKSSFDLDATPPIVTVFATYSKHRREDTLPLRQETAARLREHLRMKVPESTALKVPPRAALMIRADLEAAGIDYKDTRGRFRDFHALRHTFVTNLANSGVHPKTAQTLARHSDINLTMNTYSHSLLTDQAAALDRLPNLETPETERGEKSATG